LNPFIVKAFVALLTLRGFVGALNPAMLHPEKLAPPRMKSGSVALWRDCHAC